MKKIYFISALVCLLMFTGCTKNYKTVEEYADAMKAVRDKNNSYTIEAKQNSGTVEIYYKSSIKGNKWKNEMSMNGGSSYMQTILYDGKDVLSFNSGSRYALINPVTEMVSGEDEETKNLTINSMNQLYGLYDWTNGHFLISDLDINKMEFLNKRDNRNGYKCRLIKMDDDMESCISDEYGIAVYQKLNTKNHKTGETETLETNVVKIDTSDIPDSVFKLPKGVKKMDMDSMLDNLSKMFKN